MKKRTFKFLPGRRITCCDAQTVGEHLDKLSTNRPNGISAIDVVESARPQTSPIHSHFEWDDRLAADAHRCTQARELMRSIAIVYEVKKPGEEVRELEIRAYPHVITPSRDGYLQIEKAMNDAESRAYILGVALNEIEGWKIRYSHYSEFASIIDEINRTKRRIKRGDRELTISL